jgi:MFS family permease
MATLRIFQSLNDVTPTRYKPPRRNGSAELIRNREFVSLWFVGGALNTVRWLEMLGVGVVVFEITASPFAVALMVILRFLPLTLLGALTGALSERINRRLVLLVSMFLMGVASLGFGLMALNSQVTLWLLSASALLNGLLWAFDNPVRRTLFADVVTPAQLGSAMTLDTVTSNSTRFVGPILGGLFLEYAGIHGVFFLGALLYAAATLITLFGTRAAGSQKLGKVSSVFSALLDGFRLLRQERTLQGVMAVTLVFNVWAFPFVSMIPVIGKEVLDLTPLPLGVLMSAEGVGALSGALLILAFAELRHYRYLYTYGTFLCLVMAFAFSQMGSFLPAAGVLFLTGIGAGCFSAMQGVLVMLCTPVEARGRMMGVLSVCIGLCTVGFLHIGLLGNWLGAELAIVICTVEGFLVLLLVCRVWPEVLASQTLPDR